MSRIAVELCSIFCHFWELHVSFNQVTCQLFCHYHHYSNWFTKIEGKVWSMIFAVMRKNCIMGLRFNRDHSCARLFTWFVDERHRPCFLLIRSKCLNETNLIDTCQLQLVKNRNKNMCRYGGWEHVAYSWEGEYGSI